MSVFLVSSRRGQLSKEHGLPSWIYQEGQKGMAEGNARGSERAVEHVFARAERPGPRTSRQAEKSESNYSSDKESSFG